MLFWLIIYIKIIRLTSIPKHIIYQEQQHSEPDSSVLLGQDGVGSGWGQMTGNEHSPCASVHGPDRPFQEKLAV